MSGWERLSARGPERRNKPSSGETQQIGAIEAITAIGLVSVISVISVISVAAVISVTAVIWGIWVTAAGSGGSPVTGRLVGERRRIKGSCALVAALWMASRLLVMWV